MKIENSPRELTQVRDNDIFLIYYLLFENTFFYIARVLLKLSDIFSMETFDGMFEFSFVKQNKNRFFRSLKVGNNLKLTIYSKLNIHLPFHRK